MDKTKFVRDTAGHLDDNRLYALLDVVSKDLSRRMVDDDEVVALAGVRVGLPDGVGPALLESPQDRLREHGHGRIYPHELGRVDDVCVGQATVFFFF